MWKERKNYNNVITVKLVIPSGCNAKCTFCYMNGYKDKLQYNQLTFMEHFAESLDYILKAIGDKSQVSLDITGNEPTFNVCFLRTVLQRLREFDIKNKVLRTTMTTNGFHLRELIQDLNGAIDYVNISVHDYRSAERKEIMGWDTLTTDEYREIVSELSKIGIKTSAVSVIYRPIKDFDLWRDQFIAWCKNVGFIALRLRCDAFMEDKSFFEQYMTDTMNEGAFQVLVHENTTDAHWCRLRRTDKFRLFFLEGVMDTSILTKGIEYVIADDGRLYCDYYKRCRIEDYPFEIGKVFDYEK